jgi:hypothetical protein
MADIADIYNYLDSHNIKHSNSGFQYLMTAVQLGVEDIDSCSKVTKMYKEIAEIHGTLAANVERSIRYVIVDKNVTTKEFIMKTVYDLLYDRKKVSF